MQLVITVATPDDLGSTFPEDGPASGWDVVLEVQKDTPIGTLAVAAARIAGASSGPLSRFAAHDGQPTDATTGLACYLGDEHLAAEITVEEAGLVSGDRLGLNAPLPPADSDWIPGQIGTDWLEVHVVSGADSGRIWPVGFGTHSIGSAPSSRIRLTGAGLPEFGPVLTIDRRGLAWLTGLARTTLTTTGMNLADQTASRAGGRLTFPEPPREQVGAPDPRYRKVLEDAAAEYAALLEGARGAQRWPVGVDLAIGDTLLRLVRRFDPDAAVTPSEEVLARDFNRPPRLVPPLLQPPVKMPVPPTPPNRRPIPLMMMLAPMVLGLAFVYLFHSYFFLLISAMTPVMVISNWVQDRRSGGKQYRQDNATYRKRRMEAEKSVFASISTERLARCSASPDPAMIGLIATGPSSRLWERRRTDPDFLMLRVGTTDQPSLMELEDPAREELQRRYHWNVPDVPIALDLTAHGVIGVVGEPEATSSIARWMLAQAGTLHSPRDLRIYVLTAAVSGNPATQSAQERWSWAHWLPQARPLFAAAGSPMVTFGSDPETVANRVNELVQMVKARTEARSSRVGTVMFAEPDVLVVMDGARLLRDVPGIVQILVDGPAVRVFTIGIDAMERLLPEECQAVVRAEPDGLVVRQVDVPDLIGIRPDLVSLRWCENVARALSSLRDVTPDDSGGLPDHVRLLELLHADPPDAQLIAAGWQRRPASTTFPLGKGFDGAITFDLVRDGPHGLIAGTTGSGKSELLQTMVASLAAVNRPDELVFVLVDYKGGSAFHSCVHLPHTLGMVTDLDEALSLRALESLAAELRRREHLLAQVGAKDLVEYRAMRARDPQLPPMPRLLLVIDEFATMARETPSFVPGLVSIAQRGRSLGIHLILATQRPAGVVTSDIKANTNLRIALRVTDPGESMDVIDTKDAAHISTGTPGRALARLAHRSTLPFQTAYVGAPLVDGKKEDDETRPARMIPPPQAERLTWNGLGRPSPIQPAEEIPDVVLPGEDVERTDLDALVEAIRAAAELVGSVPQPSPWLPALPPMILLEQLNRMSADEGGPRLTRDGLTTAPFAMVDFPSLQRQQSTGFDPGHDGHLFIVGAPRAGRSQTLRTIAASLATGNSSADVHMYGIDAAGSALMVLTELPHCGGVVSRADLERMNRMINWLVTELARRHELFAQHSVADLTELRMKVKVTERPAHIILFVDGWDALAALLTDHDGGVLYALLQELLREGAGVGIHLIMTSERALVAGRVAGFTENKLMMRMTDRTDLTIIGVPAQRLPTVIFPGRAWRTTDQAEVQIAMLGPDPSGQGQAEVLREIGRQAKARDENLTDDRRPFPVSVLPTSAGFAEIFARWPTAERKPLLGLIGIGGSKLAPLIVDFSGRAHCFLIAGPSGSGRSNALATLAISLLAGGTRLVVITPRESMLRKLASHASAHLVTGPQPDPQELAALLAPGHPPTVLLIDDIDMLGLGSPADPVLREVVSVGRDRGIGIAFAGSAETIGSAMGGWLGEAKRSRQGVLLAPQSAMEGDLLGVRMVGSQSRVPVRPGRGYTTLGSAHGTLQTIVIPQTTLK